MRLVSERYDTAGAMTVFQDKQVRATSLCRRTHCPVDLRDLKLTEICPPTSKYGPLRWAGFDSHDHLWTIHIGAELRLVDERITGTCTPCGFSRDMTPHALIDSRDRIWIGVDHGEFGGGWAMLILRRASLRARIVPTQCMDSWNERCQDSGAWRSISYGVERRLCRRKPSVRNFVHLENRAMARDIRTTAPIRCGYASPV